MHHTNPQIRFAVAALLVLASFAFVFPRLGSDASIPVTALERTVFEELALAGEGTITRDALLVARELPVISALGSRWEQDLPEGATFTLAYRFGGEPWKPFFVDHDVSAARDDQPLDAWEPHADHGTIYSDMVVGRGTRVELRATLASTGPAARVRDVTALAFSSSLPERAIPVAAAAGTSIIARAEWGADETLRRFNPNNPAPKSGGKGITDEVRAKLGEEIATTPVTSVDASGADLTWPIETSDHIQKIIIHHTAGAQPTTPDEAVAYLRSVYYFHTVSRGWGDIGYNYIIDPFGNVYEGRAGGPRAVGAHASNFNIGSIGISVMGSYGDQPISPEAKRSLVALVHDLAGQEGIDTNGVQSFRLVDLPNVLGHRDVGTTSCPGDLLWSELPSIRTLAANAEVDAADPRWRPTLLPADPASMRRVLPTLPERFDGTYIDDLDHRLDRLEEEFTTLETPRIALRPAPGNPQSVSLAPGGRTTVRLSFTNEGVSTLSETTFLRLETSFPSMTVGTGESVVARIIQPAAKGETATFEIPIALDAHARGTFNLQLIPVANGISPMHVGAVRLRIIVDESALGLVDRVTDIARARGKELLTTFIGDQLPVAQPVVDVEAPPRVVLPVEADAEDALDTAVIEAPVIAPLPERLTLDAIRVPREASATQEDAPLRVRLSHAPASELHISADRDATVSLDGMTMDLPRGAQATITYADGAMQVATPTMTHVGAIVRIATKGVLSVDNWERSSRESFRPDDRRFRGVLEARASDGQLLLVNELPIEQYLLGLAEPNPKDPPEKINALVIVARTYAVFYRDEAAKFPGQPFHLDDDPNVSQRYLGVGFEDRAPEVAAAVRATRGMVVTYQGKLVKTPYFSSSDGRTRSAEEVWGWTDTPYLVSVTDPCDTPVQRGHGVGLSGCGARVLAEQGRSAEEILKTFYQGITITQT